MRISDWSSDVCSSDLRWWSSPDCEPDATGAVVVAVVEQEVAVAIPGYRRVLDHLRIPAGGRRCHAGEAVVALPAYAIDRLGIAEPVGFSLVREPHPVAAVLFEDEGACQGRSEEHTSELQSLMRILSPLFSLKPKYTLL